MKTLTKKLSLAILVTTAACLVWASSATAGSLDDELEQYWATEREMDVLLQRLYEREGRFGAGIYTGLLSSEPFFYYFPVGLRGTYHFSNALSVEVGGAFMDAGPLTNNTELTGFLERELEDGFDIAADTHDRFLWRTNAVAMWSPFYGKLAALQQKLIHFDINVAAGLGAVGVERPAPDREIGAEFNKTEVEVVLGVGAHFYVNQNIVVRLDGRGYLYRGAELPTNEGQFFQRLNFPMEFNLGVTYLF